MVFFVSFVSIRESPIEAAPLTRVTDVPVTEPLHLHQHRIFIAIDEDRHDFELVPRRFTFHPELLARAAEKRRVAGALRVRERLLVHEPDHQDLRRFGILNHSRHEPIEL